ncbi:MAG TPA: DUF4097 family beta strand repeat-containing protein [Candidatus Hydrogenedens sp.]|nr:DUF4097 domain-containing protein [Candidatus Hydrogenedens sp.]HOK09958.1 DUF4097 family beta strand repeat-containing protein [Candidatus Hydrogenedens sp.]HOL19707.1 DUF4097 family beta strand repeat-containing protein [Candidatus Hydrogenedens sp.]HPP59951.1 DUF4097 family beta strand repeat-containing protein [Candidatus Hydrogenedens sp.]
MIRTFAHWFLERFGAHSLLQSFLAALFILFAVQLFTIGVLSERLPIEVSRPYFQEVRTFTFEPREKLEIDNVDGTVNITPGKNSKISIIADIRGYPRRFRDRDKVMKFYKKLFQIIESDTRVSLKTEPHSRPEGVEFRIDYQVTVPEKIDIEINVMSRGNVYITAGCKNVSVRANQGDITIIQPEGDVFAQTILGRIDVRNVTTSADVQTINGAIYITAEKGKIKANSVNGNIQASLLTENIELCDLSVTNGNISLSFPELFSSKILAKTNRGYITSEFPLGDVLPGTQVSLIEKQIGKGVADLKLTSMNGKILISRLIQ